MPRSRNYSSLRSKPRYVPEERGEAEFRVTSTSFEKTSDEEGVEKLRFRRKCTGDGPVHQRDESPALAWHNAPEGTASFAITIVDIDAPDPAAPISPFTHWVVANIPPHITSLPEGFSGRKHAHGHVKDGEEGEDPLEGMNDFKLPQYLGPNPPTGEHRYVITVYAVDEMVHVGKKPTREKLEDAIEGHVLGEAELIATYTKEKFTSGIDQGVRNHAVKEGSLWKEGQ